MGFGGGSRSSMQQAAPPPAPPPEIVVEAQRLPPTPEPTSDTARRRGQAVAQRKERGGRASTILAGRPLTLAPDRPPPLWTPPTSVAPAPRAPAAAAPPAMSNVSATLADFAAMGVHPGAYASNPGQFRNQFGSILSGTWAG